ncbi:MAG TPA: hypothetical protein VFV08_04700, partial [Puia sp.]|nr:hypothetical protein [Puia sp.]
SLISNNPASFSAMDNQFFAGEIGIRGKFVNYTGTPIDPTNNSSTDITFRRFALGIKLTRHWGTSIGLVPFSSENYEFNSPQPILGTNGETTNAYSEGFGGINRVYWANSYELFHHLSLGINSSYLFGSISQKTILGSPNLPATYVSTNRNLWIYNLYFDYGMQYYGKIGKNWDFTIGGTFANKTDLHAENSVLILAIDSSQLKNQTINETFFTLPKSYGVGISLTKNKKYTLVADYKYQDWASLNYSGFNYALQNSERASLGFEISNKKNIFNNLYETSFFQFGAYFSKSYLNVYGQSIDDVGGTFGFGVNSKRSALSTNVIFQYGVKGTTDRNLIKENYFNITFVFGYRDFWNTKGRRYD